MRKKGLAESPLFVFRVNSRIKLFIQVITVSGEQRNILIERFPKGNNGREKEDRILLDIK